MKTLIIIGILIAVLAGCTLKQNLKAYPNEKNKVSVVGNTIYREGKPFAELRFFDMNMAETLTEKTWIDGLAIYYYQTDQEKWIYPKEGLSIHQDGKVYNKIEELRKVYGKYLHDHEAFQKGVIQEMKWPSIYIGQRRARKEDAFKRVYGVGVSEDRKYVYYKVWGMIWDSSYKYAVEYNISK